MNLTSGIALAFRNIQKLWRPGDTMAVVLRLEWISASTKGLLTQIVCSTLRLFASGGLGQGLRTCISNKFPDVDYASGLGPQFENFYPRLQIAECTILKILLLTKHFFAIWWTTFCIKHSTPKYE